MRYQKALFLVGEAGSGKSTLLKVLQMMHDPKAIGATPIAKVEEERYLTDLVRKLACICYDIQSDKKIFGENFVRITGGDPVATRRLYQEVEGLVVPTVRFIGSMNPDRPGFKAAPDALSRRLIFVPCGKKVSIQDRDRFAKLKDEQSGILARWIRALQRLETRGHFDIPELSRAEVDDYLAPKDAFSLYAQERLVLDSNARTPVGEITVAFNDWARDRSESGLPANVVGKKLSWLGFTQTFATNRRVPGAPNQRVWNARIQSARGEV
jgi:phage/plasmid-associated DNA primase